ncbi:unnamed protein product [Sphenostylis stenocarpa]|uniref:Myb-like domain-containing protein n=1 Tax=Sphenostylis stenocarpa TaxID=92480 RepID=A0AA86STU6_9FABA|nr:unnamed protein product [Sphenostylis stenocarpa]
MDNLPMKNPPEDISAKSEVNENSVDYSDKDNAPTPDGELRYSDSSHNEDLSKTIDKFKRNKKQKKSFSNQPIKGKKKLKLSEDKAEKPKSSNLTSDDDELQNRKPNSPNELDKSEVGKEEEGTVDKINISTLVLHRNARHFRKITVMNELFHILRENSKVWYSMESISRPTNSEEETNKSINDQCLIDPLLQIEEDATTMHQTEVACAADNLNKTRKRDKLPIRGGKKLSSMNKQKEPIGSSGSASPTEGKETMALMNPDLKSSGSAEPKKTRKGKEKKKLKSPTLKSSGSPLKHLLDLETIMRNKLAAMNAAVNAAASWKGANTQRSSPMDSTSKAKDTSNSSSNLENGLALGYTPSSGDISTKTSSSHSGYPYYRDEDDDWSELELEALLSFVKKYGLGNWNVKFVDPDLQVIRNKTAKELAEKWEKVAPKMLPYLPLPYSTTLSVTADRPTPHASQGNGLHSTIDSTAIQFPSAKFPIYRPSPRLGIPPFHFHAGNQALNMGRIMPSSNGLFGPHFQGSSRGAFHSLQPLPSAHPREPNANLKTMNPQLLGQFHNERLNLLARNFSPMSVQTPQTPPLSLSATTISPPANNGTEAGSQLVLGGPILLPNNLKLNKNAGPDTDNNK